MAFDGCEYIRWERVEVWTDLDFAAKCAWLTARSLRSCRGRISAIT
jgi:hypothetical protein